MVLLRLHQNLMYRKLHSLLQKLRYILCPRNKDISKFSNNFQIEVLLYFPCVIPRAIPSKEMQAAIKVINDSLQKSHNKNLKYQLKNATNIVQQEWFKVSSHTSANPLDVEDYLDAFEDVSSAVLEYIVNMIDASVSCVTEG